MTGRWTVLATMGLLLVGGCAGSTAPEWLNSRSRHYPEQAFLTGVGSGEERRSAEDRARLEIAKVFQVDIRAREYSSETAISQGETSSYRQEAASRLVATSGRLLAGVQIAEVWRDPQSRTWHALAVLDRLRAAGALRDAIAPLDRRIGAELELARQATTPLRSLAPYRRALRLERQRSALVADLRVVDGLAMVDEPQLPTGELAARIARATAGLKVAVTLDDDRGEIVRAALVRAMAAEGLALVPELECTLLLRGHIEIGDGGHSDGVAWRTATARVEVLENRQLFDTLLATVREGSGDGGRAETLARELLGRQLAAKVLELLGAPGDEVP